MSGLLPANQGWNLGLQPGNDADLVTITSPNGAKFQVARNVAGQFSGFVNDLHGQGYVIDPKQSGGFNDRTIAGTNKPSQHAFGNAIDINWSANPRGTAEHNLPANVGDIAAKYGLAWGGTWSNPDPMHFEASKIIPEMAYRDGQQTMPPRTLADVMSQAYLPGQLPPMMQAVTAEAATAAPVSAQQAGTTPTPPADPLTPPNRRYSKLADILMASAAGAKPTGWGELLNAAGDLYLGHSLAAKEDEAQRAYGKQLASALSGAQTNEKLTNTLIGSGDPELMKAGIQSKITATTPKQPPQGKERYIVDNGLIFDTANQTFREPPRTSGDASIPPGLSRDGQKEYEKTLGKEAAQARITIPAAKAATENALQRVQDLMNHPGREAGTGFSSWLDPRNYFGATDAGNFQAMNKSAAANAFMAARETLKGAGQVTDFEGKKGEESIANLTTSQSEAQYLKNLNDLKTMIEKSYSSLLQKSQGGGGATSLDMQKPEHIPNNVDQLQPRIITQAEFTSLPSGSRFIAADDPSKTVRIKP